MKLKIFKILLLLIIIVCSCREKHTDRNKLIFNDRIDNVRDSLIKLEKLLSLLPQRLDNKNINYYVEHDKLFINDSLINTDSTISPTFSNVFTIEQKRSILTLSAYLNRNFLSSGYFDENDKIWRFIYRDFSGKTFDDTRDVCVLNISRNFTLSNDTILDHKGNVYLLAPIDAKVR